MCSFDPVELEVSPLTTESALALSKATRTLEYRSLWQWTMSASAGILRTSKGLAIKYPLIMGVPLVRKPLSLQTIEWVGTIKRA